jgi:hypothetical protein
LTPANGLSERSRAKGRDEELLGALQGAGRRPVGVALPESQEPAVGVGRGDALEIETRTEELYKPGLARKEVDPRARLDVSPLLDVGGEELVQPRTLAA